MREALWTCAALPESVGRSWIEATGRHGRKGWLRRRCRWGDLYGGTGTGTGTGTPVRFRSGEGGSTVGRPRRRARCGWPGHALDGLGGKLSGGRRVVGLRWGGLIDDV